MTAPPSPTTDALVDALTRDLAPVRRLPGVATRTAAWLVLATLVTAPTALAIGARPDLAHKLSEPSYLAEGAALVVAFVAAARCAFRLGIPGLAPTALASTIPAVAWSIWALHVAHRWATSSAEFAAMAWTGGLPCVARLVALAAVPAALGVGMLRRAAPQQRGWAGLCVALAAGAIAMLGTQAICPRDAAGHVLAWHVAPLAATALIGAALGRRLLGHRRVDSSPCTPATAAGAHGRPR
jgi:hypothetical protein